MLNSPPLKISKDAMGMTLCLMQAEPALKALAPGREASA
jgi:hypothetical protein